MLRPLLEAAARRGVQAGKDQLGQISIGFSSELVNTRAAEWARRYTDDLLEQLGTTSSRLVGEALAGWFETPGSTLESLVEALTPVVSGNVARAEAIAVTEISRAYAEGQNLLYEEAGLEPATFLPPGHPRCRCWPRIKRLESGDLVVVWQTNQDELVCTEPIETPWGVAAGCHALNNVCLSPGEHLGRKV